MLSALPIGDKDGSVVRFVWHAQTNGMGVVSSLATPFAALRDVPHILRQGQFSCLAWEQ